MVRIQNGPEERIAHGMARGMVRGMARGMASGMASGMVRGMACGIARGMTCGFGLPRSQKVVRGSYRIFLSPRGFGSPTDRPGIGIYPRNRHGIGIYTRYLSGIIPRNLPRNRNLPTESAHAESVH